MVEGDFIGTDVTGTTAFDGNGNPLGSPVGVSINSGASDNTIGGTATGAGNLISGNTVAGVEMFASADNVIAGNRIGTNADGTLALPNSTSVSLGVYIVTAPDNTIGGTAVGAGNLISGNTGNGVEIVGGFREFVQGNLIGTNADGTSALGNTGAGISISSSAGGPSSGQNVIGGTTAGAGNLISGNGGGGIFITLGSLDIVAGNLIGTNASGTVPVPNAGPGIVTTDGSGITIGGIAAGAGNVVSGNDTDGIDIDSDTGDLVAGNKIGTDTSGTFALGNFESGVVISGGSSNTIGGAAAGAGNVISGNASDGVQITGSAAINNVIAGDYIGTDLTGMLAIANGTGVELDTGATGNTIGGLTATAGTGAGNVISGNSGAGIDDLSGSNVIAGNLIGLSAGGSAALANMDDGIDAFDDTIGGTAAGAGNVISGNRQYGINDDGVNLIAGNLIGTDLSGTTAAPNGFGGISLGGSGSTVGGTTVGAGNVISGNSQQGIIDQISATANLIVGNEIGTTSDGTAALANIGDGIDLDAGGNTIGGLTATPGTGAGNVISGNNGAGINDSSGSNLIAGNLIGTNASGTAGVANTGDGVDASDGDTIGGAVAEARNVISGNTAFGVFLNSGIVVVGNFIGTDITGTVAIANGDDGVHVGSSGNTIGGLTATPGTGAGNVISGNDGSGIIDGDASGLNLIAGNLIGTNAGGTSGLANMGDGIDASGDTIGGTAAGAGNVISGNRQYGINDYGLNIIAGNLIGTNLSWTTAVPNGFGGISLDASGSTIGGTTVGAGDVISGNSQVGIVDHSFATGNLIVGNEIGTTSDGTAALANIGDGIDLDAGGNTIGGLTATPGTGAGNVISGNHGAGINDSSGSNFIAGNLIGTNASGTAALTNRFDGIDVYGGGDTIGGAAAGAGNVIAGNTWRRHL